MDLRQMGGGLGFRYSTAAAASSSECLMRRGARVMIFAPYGTFLIYCLPAPPAGNPSSVIRKTSGEPHHVSAVFEHNCTASGGGLAALLLTKLLRKAPAKTVAADRDQV